MIRAPLPTCVPSQSDAQVDVVGPLGLGDCDEAVRVVDCEDAVTVAYQHVQLTGGAGGLTTLASVATPGRRVVGWSVLVVDPGGGVVFNDSSGDSIDMAQGQEISVSVDERRNSVDLTGLAVGWVVSSDVTVAIAEVVP